MKKLIFGLVLIAFFNTLPAYARHEQARHPGTFDYYLLNLSWEPAYCHVQRNADTTECQSASNGFVVHGLWPQYVDGYPQHCSNTHGPENPSALLDLIPTLWLIQHEWTTHGTCSGLDADDYFALIRRTYASINIPAEFKKPSQSFSLTPSQIKNAFTKVNPALHNENMTISCGNNQLTAIAFCLSKESLQPITCTGIHDCHANVIKVQN